MSNFFTVTERYTVFIETCVVEMPELIEYLHSIDMVERTAMSLVDPNSSMIA